MAIEAKRAEGSTREEMLAHIESSRVKIEAIQGKGPGTGRNPNLSKLSDPELKGTHVLVRHVESILAGNTF